MNDLIPALNSTVGCLDPALVLDLMAILDKNKSESEKSLSDTAYEIDDRVRFNKSANKDLLREAEKREESRKRVEAMLKQRE